MGTSVSHSSPKTSGWKAVAVCYTRADISVKRAATEIWRAAAGPQTELFEQLTAPLVTSCIRFSADAADSQPVSELLPKLNSMKQNSLVGEFAKRALLIKAAGAFPSESTVAVFFRQLTDYYVARDIAGHVGAQFRCKTVAEVRAFKQQLSDTVAATVRSVEQSQGLNRENWSRACSAILRGLTK